MTVGDDALRLVRAPVAVRELAANALRQAIVAGTLAPGERLVEATLAKRMGVSRPSLREALIQLAAERLVTITPNRGPAVSVVSWAEAEGIYGVRAVLEGEAAALMAARVGRDQVTAMRRALRAFERAIARNDVGDLLVATSEFYRTILAHCGNPVIGEVLGGLNARINYLRMRSMAHPARPASSLSEMRAILEAIARGDAPAALAASQSHVRRAAEAARAAFDRDDAAVTGGPAGEIPPRS